MKIVIHARHAELAADFREIAEEKLRTNALAWQSIELK